MNSQWQLNKKHQSEIHISRIQYMGRVHGKTYIYGRTSGQTVSLFVFAL
jgi:hypothetical protein